MKRHLAFLLSLLLGAGSALAESGETITQLSPGAALQGTEQIPMYQAPTLQLPQHQQQSPTQLARPGAA
jgi:hypothetical protein